MNIERAKELLSGNIDIPGDDLGNEMADALELLETSPELQNWMEQQEHMDPVLSGALNSTPVPDGLEEKLLQTVGAAKRANRANTHWILWVGSLAAVVTFATVALQFTPQGERIIQGVQQSVSGTTPDDFDHLRDGMAYYIRNVYFRLDHVASDLDSIENWLMDNKAPVHEFVPEELLALKPIGCKELSWQGNAVSLVCFHTGDGNIIHLFIMDRGSAGAEAYAGMENVIVSNDLETGGWTTEKKVYVLVGSSPDVDIEFALMS